MNAADASILVVDDEVDTCRNLADIFTDLGYRVDTAHDGTSALELARKHHYDVALLDLMMPGMDGVTLYYEIKKVRAGTVAMLMTAHLGHPRAEAALGTGIWRLMPKPVDLPQLMGLIAMAVNQPLVLVVDDDSDLCANLWDLLREYGYRVGLANDVTSAIHQVNDAEYRVILLDMRLPDGDGSQVFRAAQQTSPATRVIVITGSDVNSEQMIQQVLVEGVQAALQKPLNLANLLAILHQFAGGIPPGGSSSKK